MLLYLSGNNPLDVSLAANCCARYMFSPKSSHKSALKRLTYCLNQTKDHGLVLDTNSYVCKVDSCPYADISDMHVHDNPTDPPCVKIRTGFIIAFVDCPALWVLNLYKDTDISSGGKNDIDGSLLQIFVSHYRHCNDECFCSQRQCR